MDFQKLSSRYKPFGGMRLVWQYANLGAVPTVLKGLLLVHGYRLRVTG